MTIGNFLSNLLSRRQAEEPAVIGNVQCLNNEYSIDVRAQDDVAKVISNKGMESLFIRHYTLALKGATPAKTEQYRVKSEIPKRRLLSDGSIVMASIPGDAFPLIDGINGLYEIMKQNGVIVSRDALHEVIEADLMAHKDKYMKLVEPKSRSK